MSFRRVLAHAFRGCGTSLTAVQSTAAYRRQLARQTQLLQFGEAHSRDAHFAVGKACNPFTGMQLASAHRSLENCDTAGFDPEERTLLLLLAEHITEATRRYAIPRRFHAWARAWREAGCADEQLAIAEKVSALLKDSHRDKKIKSMHADMLNQPRQRVQPKAYGRWGSKSRFQPNCLGKAQMLAAFFSLCGAETISVLPLRDATSEREVLLGRIARRLLPMLAQDPEQKNALIPALRITLREIAKEGSYESQRPSWPHMAVAVKLCSGRWALVDPNFIGVGRIPGAWNIPAISTKLNRFSTQLPGLSFSHSQDTLFDAAKLNIQATVTRILEKHLKRDEARANPLRGGRALAYLSSSSLLGAAQYLMVESAKLRKNRKRGQNAKSQEQTPIHKVEPRASELALLLLQYAEASVESKETQAEHWRGDTINTLIRSGEARTLLRGGTMDECMSRLVVYLIRECLSFGSLRWRTLPTREKMHPQCEFGNLHYQIALHTTSHIGVDMGLGDETTAALMNHGYGHFLLHNAATLLSREPKTCCSRNPYARDAAAHLAQLPFKLRSSEILLEQMEQ